MLKRLKNWWLDIHRLFEVTVILRTLSIHAQITILGCRLGGELDLRPLFGWLPLFIFRLNKQWHGKIGKHKSISCDLYCVGCLSTGFSFSKRIHCDHSPCNLTLELLGAVLEVDYHDIRHWNATENRYKTAEEEEES